jgi:hypothetical protein
MTVFTLYFGEGIRGRPDLTAQEWRQFLDDTVSIDLPNGYTVSDANGAWLNPKTHATVSEPTKVLTVALPPGPDSLAAVNRVRNAYQIRFHQQLVGMTNQPACGDF